ncbi:hypothetical protein [Pseudopedobacter beijingensis]|uniref:HmuY protein n=1 Tax=Pseudopedobacter beijingensis TaxID=1207056 RepID=A0ABW4IGF6_9SPHI
MKTKHILSLTFALFVAFTACKKDNDPTEDPKTEEPNTVEPKIEESKAIVKTDILVESPTALKQADTWPEIFYDLDAQKSSATKSGQVIFTGGFNLNLAVTDFDTYKLGMFNDVNKNIEDITFEYLKTAQIAYYTEPLGLEYNGSIGWYGYNMTTHKPSAIEGRFAIIYKGESLEKAEKIYVIKPTSIGYITIDATAKTYKGQVNFGVKIYTKQ